MSAAIRILGIDPGLRRTGWGVIALAGTRLSHIAHGVITPDTEAPLATRLCTIADGVAALVTEHSPDLIGIEETLVNANPRAALLLGQARGAAMAALGRTGLPVSEHAPRQIKLSVVGTGTADKDQIGFMVARLLPGAGKLTADAADALACAICAAHYRPIDTRRLSA
jgi:crossover junction endodeoxyribonuclease RuvC